MSTRSLALTAALMLLAPAGACARRADRDVPAAPAPARDSVRTMRVGDVASGDPSREEREYVGAYSSGYELSWFQPCGAPSGDSTWWVTLTEDARLQRDSLLKRFPVRPTQGLAVRWRGTVSPKMPAGAGHMGHGSRYMLVTKIISLRALDSSGGGACSAADRVGLRR